MTVHPYREKGFTAIGNLPVQDKGLSLRAVGLLCRMLSLPPGWRFSARGLAAVSLEGTDAVRAAIAELEAAGYLRRRQGRGANGRLLPASYEVFERPASPAGGSAAPAAPGPAGAGETGCAGEAAAAGSGCSASPGQPSPIGPTQADIRRLIEYDYLLQFYRPPRIDEIVGLLCDVFGGAAAAVRVGGAPVPAARVRGRLRRLHGDMVKTVLEQIDAAAKPVKNMRGYLLTCLYNAPASYENNECALVGRQLRNNGEVAAWRID